MFVVTVPDMFARHLVTKVTDDWHQAVRWARRHSADGCALIRDQQANRELCIESVSDPMLDWMYV